ncbi:hypothetical protein [Chondrinema litorale]|uniref:hypothetical protein n=1 Tax=Chondrinema litorale TaxID=2994555 RepID=UPI00254271F5|nr:hypothetical protein [Chondrinema litorale]UZR95564.1 hypothetical protein OQ292_07020 [Chondrinema litorale]
MKKFITLLVIGGMFVFVTIQSASTKSNIDSLKTTSISKKSKDENKKSSDLTSKPQEDNATVEPRRATNSTIDDDYEVDSYSTD